MMVHVRSTGLIPVPVGPVAPVLERAGDPFSWHAMADLPPLSVRRRRLLDVIAPVAPVALGDEHQIDLHFRDSHKGADGVETVLHEYTVTGAADPVVGKIVSVAARAQVLPWLECPGAVASAERLAGMELSSLRPVIRNDFVGRSTCTHLNDSLRSLADITALAREFGAHTIMSNVTSPLLVAKSTDEFAPQAPSAAVREAAARFDERVTAIAPKLGLSAADHAFDRRGTATALRSLDAAHGGGFFSRTRRPKPTRMPPPLRSRGMHPSWTCRRTSSTPGGGTGRAPTG